MSDKARDLDETRRLLYAGLALAADRYNVHLPDHATLIGTIANALAHHRPTHKPRESLAFATGLAIGNPDRVQQAWDLIAAITADLSEPQEG